MLNSSFFFKKKIMFDGMSTLKKQLINIHSSVILLSIKFTKRKQRKKTKEEEKTEWWKSVKQNQPAYSMYIESTVLLVALFFFLLSQVKPFKNAKQQ